VDEANRKLDELLDLDKHKLATIPERKANPTEKWMKYLGFPLGIAVFLLLFYMPTPAGLTAAGQAVLACFSLALIALAVAYLVFFRDLLKSGEDAAGTKA
jgi:hypothetical protein